MKKPLLTAISTCVSLLLLAQATTLKHGHAHNDYVHHKPLFDALNNGFTSIEVDVFLHNNKLIVDHLDLSLNSKKDIEELYLRPLQKLITENDGHVYKNNATPVTIMIDFKTGGDTYSKLLEVLRKYSDLVTVYKGDRVLHQKAINILLSGNTPIATINKQDTSLVTIDASISRIGATDLNYVK